MEYFTHVKLTKDIYRITDFTGVCCYLVIGSQKALLLDTCNGIGNIKEYVESITKLPITVILSHGHLDHMGGTALFDDIYMNYLDMPVFKKHGNMEFRVEDTMIHSHVKVERKDFVETYTGEIKNIEDGQTFDAGGVHVKMILVKGHTPGMMCPLIIEDRVCVFGDACGVGVLLFDEYSSSVSEYKESLMHLKEYESEYDTIYRNHGTFFSPKELLNNVIECCNHILNHTDAHIPVDFHGVKLYSCCEQSENGHGRKDGKEGNILYSKDKAN
ncbi:MAG: MBL fold metallo-hydrolase [Thomasclavelia sp.]|nr:MBL fold metallo-hydrolase [Thomasclavelia sp.]